MFGQYAKVLESLRWLFQLVSYKLREHQFLYKRHLTLTQVLSSNTLHHLIFDLEIKLEKIKKKRS